MNNEQHRPSLLDVPISYFEYDQQQGSFANVPARQTTLRRIVNTTFYRSTIEAIRAETDKAVQERLKKQLAAFTPVSWLYHRRRDTSFAQKIRQQWPLLMGDVDKKDNPNVDMGQLKKHLARLSCVLLCADSVRGGLWFVVRLPDHQTPESLLAHFRHLQKVFSHKFGVALDTSKGGNPTDLRFVSYDANPYINEKASVMSGTYTRPKPKPYTVNYNGLNGQEESELLNWLIRYTEAAPEGQRHATLLKAATLAGGYIASGAVDEATVVYALETVFSQWPNSAKSHKTLRDGIDYGLKKPIYPNFRQEHQATLIKAPVAPASKAVTLLAGQNARPDSTPKTEQTQIERLTVEPSNDYSSVLVEANQPGAVPCISAKSFHKWQQQHEYFGRMGLASLNQ
ncbi:MAG: hypothetical protein JWP57_3242 [Spirosoma sp.]|nr:hypothetical protein [Spirosoma sp.]